MRGAEVQLEVGIIASACIVSLVSLLKWRAWLRYLDRAAERGDLVHAAKAAAMYPDREYGLASVTKALSRRRPSS